VTWRTRPLFASRIVSVSVWIVVTDLEPAEFAVASAAQERCMSEVAERALAGIEQARDFVLGEIADDWGIEGLNGFTRRQASSDGTVLRARQHLTNPWFFIA